MLIGSVGKSSSQVIIRLFVGLAVP